MDHIIVPELRKTSEIPYHADTAPGQRYVFIAKDVFPFTAFYVVGRKVIEVPHDQPKWLEPHRHNCPTYYILVGNRADLTGLQAQVSIEHLSLSVESPVAIFLPPYAFHSYRLIGGSGWSFHANTRPDYSESLVPEDAATKSFDGLQPDDVANAATPLPPGISSKGEADPTSRPSRPLQWRFIGPEVFSDPWVELDLWQFTPAQFCQYGTWRWAATNSDQISLLFSQHEDQLELLVCSDNNSHHVRSPVTFYHQKGLPYSYEYLKGSGFLMRIKRLEK